MIGTEPQLHRVRIRANYAITYTYLWETCAQSASVKRSASCTLFLECKAETPTVVAWSG